MSTADEQYYNHYVLADVLDRVKQPAQAATDAGVSTATTDDPDAGVRGTTSGAAADVMAAAATVGRRVRVDKRDYQLGDVRVNATAAKDIRSHGVLFTRFGKTDTDQRHVLVQSSPRGKMSDLGY